MATAHRNIELLDTSGAVSVKSRQFRSMTLRATGGLAVLAFLGSSSGAHAQDVSGADRIIHQLYADLGHVGEHHRYPAWWRFLSARTQAQHDRLRALDAKSGDASINYDWLCQCQDTEALRVTSVKVSSTTPTHASAIVHFANGSDRQVLRLLLVREGTWKIEDMVNNHGRRFTDDLRAGLDGYAKR